MTSGVRRLLGAAMLVPVLYFGALILGAWLYPGYSSLTQQPSDLGAMDAPHPAILNIGLMLAGASTILGGFGLAGAARHFGGGRMVPVLLTAMLALAGTYLILIGNFPLPDPRHYSVSPLALAIHPAPFLLAAGLWRNRSTRSLARYLGVTGVVMLAMLGVMLGVGSLVTRENQGLMTRIYALTVFPWAGVAGYVLRRKIA
jgi:hypothetical membrane protein